MKQKNTSSHRTGLYVLGSLYPEVTGGMEIFNFYFLNHQLDHSPDNIIYFGEKKASNEKGKYISYKKKWPVRIFYPFQFFLAVLKIRSKPDYAYFSYAEQSWIIAFSHALVMRIFKIPYVVTIHWGKEPDWKFKSPFKYYFKKAYTVVGVSEPVCIAFKKTIPDQEFLYLPPLIPFRISSSSQEEAKKALGFNFNEKILLYVGSLKEMKNPDKIVKALSEIDRSYLDENHIRLVIVGTGEMELSVKNQIAALDLSEYVHMSGLVSRERIANYYAASDVYIISSDYEGTSLSLLEAMCNGLVIIGSNAPGINKMLNHKQNALLYEIYDTKQLAETISLIFTDEPLRKKLGKRALEDFNRNYSYLSMIEKYQSIFSAASL